jgi:eukaryotic-like serine/threonine-protein kinase
MQNAEWIKIKDLFHQTIDLPKAEREILLADQDDFVRSEVSRLLASNEKLEDFIVEPIVSEIGLDVNSYLGKRIGSYKILKIIGTGGMGQVFLAEKESLDKRFALKIIKRGMDTEAVLKRFVRERQILSRLEHPNIATLLDAGSTENDLPYFVMEFVDGLPITKFCNEHQFDTKERLEVFQKVCDAVKYAHQNLIIHRDIKPSNILVTADGMPKLLDFGIAKLLNSEDLENTTTAMQSRMLTPEYASPEQLNGQPITTATDVYSLGVVLYELLSGVRPFKSDRGNFQKIANLVLTQEPVRPSSVFSSQWSVVRDTNEDDPETQKEFIYSKLRTQNLKLLVGDLDNIILKALRKEPERRYQSVQEFSEDIRRYSIGLPVTATADTTFYRFSKFIKRNRVTTSIAMLILSISSIAVWQGFVANSERAKAATHIAQVREVAKTLLGETSQNLTNVPNGLEVRQAIIEKSAMALDSLSAEVNDAEFLSELGSAYQQLGWSQIWHLRDSERALTNLQKGRELNERAVKLDPNNAKYLLKLAGTMGSLLEFYQQRGDQEKVVEIYQTTIGINLRRIELDPNNSEIYFDNSGVYSDLHEVLGGLKRNDESKTALDRSFEMIQRAIEIQQAKEQTPEIQSQLAFYLLQKAYLFGRLEKKDEAISTYLQAAENADKSFSADNSQKLAFNHSTRSRRMAAEIYSSEGNWQKALELYQTCLARWIENKENKHLDQKGVQTAIPTYTMRVGIALDKLGKKEAGRETLEKGLNLYLTNLKNHENLAADINSAPEFLLPATNYFVANNQNRKAADLWQREFINRLEIIVKKNPNDIGMLNALSGGYRQKGDILSDFQASDNSISETNNAFLKEALENYEKALEYTEKNYSRDETFSNAKLVRAGLEQRINLLRTKMADKTY